MAVGKELGMSLWLWQYQANTPRDYPLQRPARPTDQTRDRRPPTHPPAMPTPLARTPGEGRRPRTPANTPNPTKSLKHVDRVLVFSLAKTKKRKETASVKTTLTTSSIFEGGWTCVADIPRELNLQRTDSTETSTTSFRNRFARRHTSVQRRPRASPSRAPSNAPMAPLLPLNQRHS